MDTHRVSNRRARIGLVGLVMLTGLMVFALFRAQEIIDWFYFLRYQPPDRIEQLAEKAGMSPRGKRLFYRTSPSIVAPEEIATRCDVHNLGCINEEGRVFILEYGNEAGRQSAVVTAAHEMLHFAYFRLDDEEKDRVEGLLQQQLNQIGNQKLKEYLNERGSSSAYYDEAHSILATEYNELTPELKQYYSQYFTDRGQVVEAFQESNYRQTD